MTLFSRIGIFVTLWQWSVGMGCLVYQRKTVYLEFEPAMRTHEKNQGMLK